MGSAPSRIKYNVVYGDDIIVTLPGSEIEFTDEREWITTRRKVGETVKHRTFLPAKVTSEYTMVQKVIRGYIVVRKHFEQVATWVVEQRAAGYDVITPPKACLMSDKVPIVDRDRMYTLTSAH